MHVKPTWCCAVIFDFCVTCCSWRRMGRMWPPDRENRQTNFTQHLSYPLTVPMVCVREKRQRVREWAFMSLSLSLLLLLSLIHCGDSGRVRGIMYHIRLWDSRSHPGSGTCFLRVGEDRPFKQVSCKGYDVLICFRKKQWSHNTSLPTWHCFLRRWWAGHATPDSEIQPQDGCSKSCSYRFSSSHPRWRYCDA